MKHTDWYKKAIIYQIYPRSFLDTNNDGLGDIPGIISKLDYLKQLGVNCVWLSPIYDSPQEDNGYDISNYYDVYPPFGTLEDMKVLIKELHKRDIKLIMDLVVNHTSSEHKWFQDVINNKDSKYKDYYIIRKGKKNGKKPPNNWSGFFGEGAWEKLPNSEDDYYLHLFAKGQPDLNWENPKVREEVKNILRYWLDLGVDGFRCDVINLISKKQDFKSRHKKIALTGSDAFIYGPRLDEYLHELYEDVYANYDCMTVGETVFTTLKDVKRLTSKEHKELDMVFNFDHTDVDDYFGIKYIARKFSLKRFKRTFDYWQKGLENDGWNTLFIENHDQRRSVGRFATDENKYRIESAKSLAGYYFLMRGTPFIYQGQEIGTANPGFKDVNEINDVETHNIVRLINKFKFLSLIIKKDRLLDYARENARSPICWDDSEYGGFSSCSPWCKLNSRKDEINVDKALKDKDSIFYYYQNLIKIRKQYEVINNGTYIDLLPKHKSIAAYERKYRNESLIVISSFSKKKERLKLNLEGYNLLLTNYKNNATNILEPYESRIYYKS